LKRQKAIIFSLLAIFISCFSGCSARGWYEGAQISAEHNCNNVPLSEREECLGNVNNKTYIEYQQELE